MKEAKIICWKCDARFSVDVEELEKPRPVILRGEPGRSSVPTTARPKVYVVQCPNCGSDNEIEIALPGGG
jgi:transcription elongation factor Elf1